MTHSRDKEIREKLVARGASSLTDAELLSILLGEGSHEGSAIELSENILSQQPVNEGFASLARMELSRLRMTAGMGIKKAAIVAAALETGRRMGVQQTQHQDTVADDQDVVRIFQPMLSQLQHEEFWVVYLSSANRITDKIRISQGGVSGTVVDHKLIVKRAVERLSTAIIVIHNHPSGIARPSAEDIALTERLQTAASLFDISLLDHIIITSGAHYSFRKEGRLSSK